MHNYNTVNLFSHIFSEKKNSHLFKVVNNIPYNYILLFLKSFNKKKLFTSVGVNSRWTGLYAFTKPTRMVFYARNAFMQVFFLNKKKRILTKVIDTFFNWTGFQIYFFFYKTLFFFYKNIFFFYKNIFFFYKNSIFLLNNIYVYNFWTILRSGDNLKCVFSPHILVFFYKVLVNFNFKKNLNKLLFTTIKHLFNKNYTAKYHFNFFWKKNPAILTFFYESILIDYRSGTMFVLADMNNRVLFQNWNNWFSFNIYNWKYII